MKKKILALCLVIVLAITAVTGATLAYFTDTDSAENVFTVGNIDIDLREWQDKAEGTPFKDVDNVMPGETYTKIVDVKNVGKNDAYVRVTIVVPKDMTPVWNDSAIGENSEWTKASETTEADGSIKYVFTRNSALAPEAVSSAILTAVTLDADVTELTMKDSYKVLVNAEAIQADSFATAADAYKALTDAATNIAKKTDAANLDEVNAALADEGEAQVVTLTDNITSTDTIEMKNDESVLNGNGKTIDITVADGNNYGVNAKGGTIKDVTIKGNTNGAKGFRAIFAHDLTNDLVIEGATLSGTYPLNVQTTSGKTIESTVTVKDSTLNGWTSIAPIGGAVFDNVTFGEAEGYKTFRTYSDAVLTDCDFATGFNFSAFVEGLTIELNNCKVDGNPVTAENFKTIFSISTDATEMLTKCTVVVDGVTVVW